MVSQKARVSKPVGSMRWMAPVSPAFVSRSGSESAMPEARTGLPLMTLLASCAEKVRRVPLGWMTVSPIFTSMSFEMKAWAMSGS